MTQTSTLPSTAPDFLDFHPVILCTASRRVRGGEASEGGYIQGAADDHEAWSHGLTPSLFWNNRASLLHTNEEDLPTKIAQLVSEDRGADASTTLISPTTTLYVSASQNVDLTSFDTVISCTPDPLPHASLKEAGVRAYLHLPCQTGKLGSRDLRARLPALHQLLNPNTQTAAPKTLICCPTGKDLAVGTALAYLCLFVSDGGEVGLQKARETRRIDKTLIKQRLSWITTSNPALNPSRATLQSVNSALMSSESPKRAAAGANPEIRDPTLHDASWTLLPLAATSETDSVKLTDDTTTHDDTHTAAPNHPVPPPTPPPPPRSRPESLFTRLRTTWSFTRSLTSTHPTHPSGTVTGTATITRTPLPHTLLYAEQGTFATTAGPVFTARRKYVYQLSAPSLRADSSLRESGAEERCIVVRFFDDAVRREDVGVEGEGVGGLFVEMGEVRESGSGDGDGDGDGGTEVWEARNRETHLCGEDLYAASWRFGAAMLRGGEGVGDGDEEGMWWEVRYDVQGPRKGYVSSTRYERVDET